MRWRPRRRTSRWLGVAEPLIDAGQAGVAGVGRVDQGGQTPLSYAALDDDVDEVRRLLAEGASPNHRDLAGFTPLHFAAQQHSVASAQVLLDHGARVTQEDVYGNTPLFTAVFGSDGRGDLILLLRAHGADPWHLNKGGVSPVSLARLIANYEVAQYFADLPDALIRHRARSGTD